ncbi:MAG: hypothetical protein GX446_11170 [Chthonomonadales bacterium]|nr:hypothetical protein [Chthonomonadales bacterium]
MTIVQGAAVLAGLLVAACLASDQAGEQARRPMKLPSPFAVAGKPILGSYNLETPDDIAAARDVGMNLVLGGADHLDPTKPLGRACADNGVYVLHHLTQHVYGRPRLLDRLSADATEIPLFAEGARPHPESGVIQLDDELIRYEASEPGRLLRCQRGYCGTRPAVHRGGMILFWPEECEREILQVRDSRMLWGYYVLDDSPGDAISALRGIYRLAKRLDPQRVVAAGYGSAGSLCNFGPGVCDLMLIYWYPVFGSGRYDPLMTSHQVQWMVAAARRQVPGMPFAGVYQTFDAAFDRPENAGKGLPTAAQIRKQIEDFVREGACGLVAYLGGVPSLPGWTARPYMREVIRETHREIGATGALLIPPEPPEMRAQRVFAVGGARRPPTVPGVPPAWHVILPFGPAGAEGINAVYPPETDQRLSAAHQGRHGAVRWEPRRAIGGVIGLGELLGGHNLTQNAIAYATCEVISPTDQTVRLLFGSDDDMVIWLNGREVVRRVYAGGLQRDAEMREAHLSKGKNRLLVKVHNRAGMWGFHLRIAGQDGRPLSGLRFVPRG